MRWGSPKEYAEYHRICGSLAQKSFLRWLEAENPELHKLTLKEIEGAQKKRVRGGRPDDAANSLGGADGEG